jgi:hypothetical protein
MVEGMGLVMGGKTCRQSSTQTETALLASQSNTGSAFAPVLPLILGNGANIKQLAAFGFLSSDEVFRNGVVNAGILDQVRAPTSL